MVRTLASNVKAIGGKTPKKAAAMGGRSAPAVSSKSKSGSKSGGVSWRSIPITKQEVPSWQKPITNFFPRKDGDDGASSSQDTPENNDDGASSSQDTPENNDDGASSSQDTPENNGDEGASSSQDTPENNGDVLDTDLPLENGTPSDQHEELNADVSESEEDSFAVTAIQ